MIHLELFNDHFDITVNFKDHLSVLKRKDLTVYFTVYHSVECEIVNFTYKHFNI